MTTLAALIEEGRARGFTHVMTGAGPVALEQWRPPHVDGLAPNFEWVSPKMASQDSENRYFWIFLEPEVAARALVAQRDQEPGQDRKKRR